MVATNIAIVDIEDEQDNAEGERGKKSSTEIKED